MGLAMGLALVKAEDTEDDARRAMEWRNDPATLTASFHMEPKRWPEFRDEFAAFFLEPLPPLFAEQNGVRVAFVRFRRCGDPEEQNRSTLDISINVAPKWRGAGVGRATVEAATAWAFANSRCQVLLAEIKPSNRASVRIFLDAGYRAIGLGTHEVDGQPVSVERFVSVRNGPVV